MKRPERQERLKQVKAVKVCPKCQGFMIPKAQFAKEGEKSTDHVTRSFGGVEIRTFECEKCHYTGQYQVDPFPSEVFDND